MNTAKVLCGTETHISESKNDKKREFRLQRKPLNIQIWVQNAFKCISPVWPIETFIACNPLQGFESIHFEEAIKMIDCNQNKSNSEELKSVNIQMIKWCSGFFDSGQSSIEMPNRELGFYLSFLKLAYFDRQLHQNKKQSKLFLKQLPENPEEVIKICLAKLNIPSGKEEAFFLQTLLYLPGWAGFVKWHSDNETENKRVRLIDFLAVRLVVTCLLWPKSALVENQVESDKGYKILDKIKKNETIYREKLLHALLTHSNKEQANFQRKEAQFVFCIDVRSEPFRRSIESLGHYETFGFAGFFGIPIRVHQADTQKSKSCCPVLLKPRFDVQEKPIVDDPKKMKRHEVGQSAMDGFKNLYMRLKHNFSTPFALAESMGFFCGIMMLLKSLAPNQSKTLIKTIKNWIKPELPKAIIFESEEPSLMHGISLEEQITYGETVLRLIGLTSGFSKMVIFCGHGSQTENNPYASALDCGACGGNHGGVNAQLLASILNKPEVRRGLEERGMHIPLDTVFYGAIHNTTIDVLELYIQNSPKPIYPQLLDKVQNDLIRASLKTTQERCQDANPQSMLTKSHDWSETRPEWGLARNAAFIVAPRRLTQDINLDGRCFLHSYRWEEDEDGALLETILTAPMVVAEWINTQYLFSTLDNVSFGSGSKITHNVVGKIGVMQGNGSDLMHGLPLQSVMRCDDIPYHEPQRLLVVVYAPKERISKLINKHEILQKLFFNEWVNLVIIDPIHGLHMSWRSDDALQKSVRTTCFHA